MKNINTIAVIGGLFLSSAPAFAGVDSLALSSSFSSQYDGDEIWNGVSLQNDWFQNGGHTSSSLALSGSNLVISPNASNGWVEHDNGSTPWELGSGEWTVEISTKLNNLDGGVNDGFVIWGERENNRAVLWIQGNSVTDLNGNLIGDGFDNTDGFHTFRVAFDPADTTASATGTHHVWRDDVLLSGTGVDINLAGGTNSRLIIGDCCTGIGNPVDQFELGYIRYEASEALAPVPEPNSMLLAGLSVAIVAIRRRR